MLLLVMTWRFVRAVRVAGAALRSPRVATPPKPPGPSEEVDPDLRRLYDEVDRAPRDAVLVLQAHRRVRQSRSGR